MSEPTSNHLNNMIAYDFDLAECHAANAHRIRALANYIGVVLATAEQMSICHLECVDSEFILVININIYIGDYDKWYWGRFTHFACGVSAHDAPYQHAAIERASEHRLAAQISYNQMNCTRKSPKPNKIIIHMPADYLGRSYVLIRLRSPCAELDRHSHDRNRNVGRPQLIFVL